MPAVLVLAQNWTPLVLVAVENPTVPPFWFMTPRLAMSFGRMMVPLLTVRLPELIVNVFVNPTAVKAAFPWRPRMKLAAAVRFIVPLFVSAAETLGEFRSA